MHFLEYIHPETNPPKDSIALVIPVTASLRHHKIAVAQRLTGFRKGEFTFPGGGMEPGERPKRAAIREASEEANLRFYESDLIPAQRNPSIERWQGGFHYVYMYFAYLDRRKMKPMRMEQKLGNWQYLSEKQLYQSVRSMKLPSFVLNGWWLDTLRDTRYDKLS